jgi:rSAM/selenodomain-associated transferase 1
VRRPSLIVIAKAPRAGHSKTRLCPPCTPVEAARLAKSALADTLDAVRGARADRRLLALEGPPGAWLPPGMELTAQRGRGLGERLAAAFEDAGGPAFLVAMDTPQLTRAALDHALDRLAAPGVDAVLGPTRDGGYWGIGLRRPDPAVFEGVPMSAEATWSAQMARLAELELATVALPPLTDVDTIEDARAVARAAPGTRFARALADSGHAADEREPVAHAGA